MAEVNVADFKRAAARFATGVTVVTSRKDREIYGITVSAFSSLSLDPILVVVSVRNENLLRDMILETRVFAVNVLREEQREVSRYFATHGRETCVDRFPDIGHATAVTGAPILDHCLAYFDCRLTAAHDGGDHTILVGEVVDVGSAEGAPLLYFDGDYRGLRQWETAGA
jgi:flavin reductase (DIM6/NTAB) family NADH-FMN oxidoreductase RutF